MQSSGYLLADAESWILLADAKSWISVGRCRILDSCWLMNYPGFLLADALSWIPVGWYRIQDSCWLMHYPGFLLADAESLTHIGWYRIAVNRKQKSYWQFNSTMRRWMWISKKFIWSWFNSTSRYRKWWAGSITQIPCRGFTWYSTNRDSKRSWI